MAGQAALVVAGLAVLLLAGDLLVRGAVNASLRLGVPALLVGLTIVAFGTSAPELIVSVNAVLSDAPGLALGNVVGSNIANILLVLGVPALIAGMRPQADRETQRSFTIMLAVSILFIAVCFVGPVRWPHALGLLAALGFVMVDWWRGAQRHRDGPAGALAPEGADPALRWRGTVLFVLAGLIGLPLGAEMLVRGSVSIATELGVSDAVIGLTIVAAGTSLPELATTLMAARRREAGVALGNVIGSNIFNLLAIIGIAGLVGPLPVPEAMLRVDLWVMLAASLLLLPVIAGRAALSRVWGVGLTAAYAAYVTLLFLGGGLW